MPSRKLQKAALVAREAHEAVLELKEIVDSATQNIHKAELATVGQAVGNSVGEDAVEILRSAAEAIDSASFDAAVSQARIKIKIAVASHLDSEEA